MAKRGSGWVRMADVARLAGVSMMTVSRTYQDAGRVSAETRRRIAEAAAKLGYVPNRAAAQLSSSRSRVVAATIPFLSEVQFGNTLEGLSAPLRQAGYQLLIAECGPTPEEEERAVSTVLGYRPDALVVIGVDHGVASRTMISAAGIPVVETWDLDQSAMDMAAGFSNRVAACQMTEHLIALGRRRIGYVDFTGPATHRFAERRHGFREAMQKAGLAADLILEPNEGGYGFARGRDAVRLLLARDPEMDALFCATDPYAVGAVLECQARGREVPGQIAIAGFGDFEIAAEIAPGITTIRIDPRGIGRAAAEMVLARIAGEADAGLERDLGFELVRRGSA
ncbi:LacI family DNA-binding transcriptional regulator [Roseomonas xinghualingensis]|uniref:LacI family DNA-binding transcriptional regulator n=1 Tax=Roseomonas xinghualingensis TaxID=2986475 RepID=UPI0021F15386|nr:LacI family DNA-binding transcriptional regulator [Roseomonas sp. SXEYE001]